MLNLLISLLGLVSLVGAPSSAQRHLESGKLLFHQGDYPAAIVHLTSAVRSAQDVPIRGDARHLLARAQAAAGDFAKAAETFQDAVMEAQGPQATVLVDILHFEYGKTLTELRRFEEARHAFSEVVENPNSPHREAAALLIAKTWDAEGKPKPAIKAYERFLRRWPASPTVRDTSLRLAQLLIKKRRGLRAVGILTRIFRQSPNSRAGKQAKRELAKLAKSGMRSARLDLPASRMNHIGWLLSDRRFRDALAPTLKHLAWAKGAGQRFEVMRALNILSRIYEETRQEAKALEIYAEIRKRNGFGPTLSKKMRLLALAGKYAEAEALLAAS